MEAEERGWIRRRMEGERKREREGGRRYMRLVTSIFNEASTTVACRNHLFVRSSDLPPDRTLRDIPAITR